MSINLIQGSSNPTHFPEEALLSKIQPDMETLAFRYQQGTQDIIENMAAFKKIIDALYTSAHPELRSQGLIGGASSVHPSAYRADLLDIQEFFYKKSSLAIRGVFSLSQEDVAAVVRAKTIIDVFMEDYKYFIGLGICYPDESNPETYYLDREDRRISEEAFNAIKAGYIVTLDETKESLSLKGGFTPLTMHLKV